MLLTLYAFEGVLLPVARRVVDDDRPEGIDRHVLDREAVHGDAVVLRRQRVRQAGPVSPIMSIAVVPLLALPAVAISGLGAQDTRDADVKVGDHRIHVVRGG